MLQLIKYVRLAEICKGHWPLGISGFRSCRANSLLDATICLVRRRASWWLAANIQARKNLPKDFSCCVCHPDVSPRCGCSCLTQCCDFHVCCQFDSVLSPLPTSNAAIIQSECWVTFEGPKGLWAVAEEWITHLCDLSLSIFSAFAQDQAAVRRRGRPLQAVQPAQSGAGQAHLQVRLHGSFRGQPERRQSKRAAGAEAPPLCRPEVTAAGTDACAH